MVDREFRPRLFPFSPPPCMSETTFFFFFNLWVYYLIYVGITTFLKDSLGSKHHDIRRLGLPTLNLCRIWLPTHLRHYRRHLLNSISFNNYNPLPPQKKVFFSCVLQMNTNLRPKLVKLLAYSPSGSKASSVYVCSSCNDNFKVSIMWLEKGP